MGGPCLSKWVPLGSTPATCRSWRSHFRGSTSHLVIPRKLILPCSALPTEVRLRADRILRVDAPRRPGSECWACGERSQDPRWPDPCGHQTESHLRARQHELGRITWSRTSGCGVHRRGRRGRGGGAEIKGQDPGPTLRGGSQVGGRRPRGPRSPPAPAPGRLRRLPMP